METVLLSANIDNIEACVDVAIEHGLGIEVMAFAFPQILDVHWQKSVQAYRSYLRHVPGPITLHGPFMDMAPGSPDRRIDAVCRARYQLALHIASELEAEKIVFHANFISAIHSEAYRRDWHKRNVEFWYNMADYAQDKGVPIAVENMWEFDPAIIGDVLAEVNHPYLRACLDVGHAHLYGPDYSFEEWFNVFEPFMIHTHMNNTAGKLDSHNALGDGVIDYNHVLNQFRQMEAIPTIVLEMYSIQNMLDSLPFFELADVTA